MAGRRILRVAELIEADVADVARETRKLPRRVSAAIAEVPSGVLVTLEVNRRPWDRLQRKRILARLTKALNLIEQRTAHRTVVAAAIIRQGRVLVARRAHPPELAGQWEFPGGKVERGETTARALERECAEELGVPIVPGAEVDRRPLPDGATLVLLLATLATGSPEPRALEHQDIRWADADDLAQLDWIATNRDYVSQVTVRL